MYKVIWIYPCYDTWEMVWAFMCQTFGREVDKGEGTLVITHHSTWLRKQNFSILLKINKWKYIKLRNRQSQIRYVLTVWTKVYCPFTLYSSLASVITRPFVAGAVLQMLLLYLTYCCSPRTIPPHTPFYAVVI